MNFFLLVVLSHSKKTDSGFCFSALKTFVNIAKKNANNFGLLIPSENKRSKKIFLIKEPKGAPVVFVEKKKFLKMKGYDENFFLYYEDIDFLQKFLNKKEKIFQIPVYFSHKFGSHDKIYNNLIKYFDTLNNGKGLDHWSPSSSSMPLAKFNLNYGHHDGVERSMFPMQYKPRFGNLVNNTAQRMERFNYRFI